MKKILITRPHHQARNTIEDLEALGLSALSEPLLRLKKVPHEPSDNASYQCFIVTSGNSFDFWDMQTVDKTKPLIAVGPHTAQRARICGFTNVTDMDGTVRDIKDNLESFIKQDKALHVGGFNISHSLGAHVDRLIVYEALPVETLSTACKTALTRGDIGLVTFYSTRTAKVFVRLIKEEKLEKKLENIRVLSISSNVLRSVRVLPWADIHQASTPNGTAMIENCRRIMKDEYAQSRV